MFLPKNHSLKTVSCGSWITCSFHPTRKFEENAMHTNSDDVLCTRSTHTRCYTEKMKRHTRIHSHIYTYIRRHIHTYTHSHTHTHTYIPTHSHTHTHKYVHIP